ncbi:MAG: hypothetical protein CR968_03595 [Flavobacteriia bacterium]|nr:MAG: hypothetical protein CR968_03595 [Flavobacteriia bacterium]
MTLKIYNNHKLNIFEFHIVNLLAGFSLILMIPHFFGDFDYRYIGYPYKIFTFLISFYIIYLNYDKKWNYKITLVTLFFFIYFIRIVYDLYILNIDYTRKPYEYVATYIASTLIPAISVFYLDEKKINWRKVLLYTYFCFCFFASINILFSDFVGNESRSSGITPMWPIGFGQTGTTLIILSIFVYNLFKKNLYKILVICSSFLGLIIIVMSASKGPLLSLLFALVIYLFTIGIPNIFKNILFIIMFLALAILAWKTHTVHIVERITQSIQTQDPSTLERLEILNQTLINIKTDPLLGHSFLIQTAQLDSYYPHNLLLEAFMTTGIIGGILFLVINFIGLSEVKKILHDHKNMWIVFIFIQFFVQTFLSFSLYSSNYYWALLMMIFLVYSSKKTNSYPDISSK